jgi:hypothetical protein
MEVKDGKKGEMYDDYEGCCLYLCGQSVKEGSKVNYDKVHWAVSQSSSHHLYPSVSTQLQQSRRQQEHRPLYAPPSPDALLS